MLETIKDILKNYTEVDPEIINENTNLQADLDLNSFDVINLIVDFEDAFNIEIPDEDVGKLITIKDILVYLNEKAGGLECTDPPK